MSMVWVLVSGVATATPDRVIVIINSRDSIFCFKFFHSVLMVGFWGGDSLLLLVAGLLYLGWALGAYLELRFQSSELRVLVGRWSPWNGLEPFAHLPLSTFRFPLFYSQIFTAVSIFWFTSLLFVL